MHVQVYDVLNFDLIVMIRTPYVPGCCEWIFKVQTGAGIWGRGGGWVVDGGQGVGGNLVGVQGLGAGRYLTISLT